MTELTSRERMLRALNLEEPDHIPCCFMSFTALRRRHDENMYELSKAERAMGLDSMLFIPVAPRPRRPEHPELRGLPVRFAPEVEVKGWREEVEGGFGMRRTWPSSSGKPRRPTPSWESTASCWLVVGVWAWICSSGAKPLLDFYLEAGIDVLIGVDPVQGTHTDMPLMKSKLGERTCLWGGVSGAVTVEMGAEEWHKHW
jgi:hypothetical protein